MTLAQQFAAYHEWRNQLAGGLSDFRRWLSDNELCDAQTDQRIDRLLEKLREDRNNVAHAYDEERAIEIAAHVRDEAPRLYARLLDELRKL